MARQLRIEYPGAWYHVTCRGNDRQAIFRNDLDRMKFLEMLATSAQLYRVALHAYVLMENHFHIILMTPEGNLHSFMHQFNTSYTVYFNRRHKRSGHLYQGRYKAFLIDADSYLLELSRYVHLNPVRIEKYSQLCIKEKRRIIRAYRWSSYGGYVRRMHRQSFVTYSKILTMVGGTDDDLGRKRYEAFVLGGVLKDMNYSFWEDVRGQAVLGSERFLDWIYECFLSKKEIDFGEQPGVKELLGGRDTMAQIARAVSRAFDVPEKELYRRGGTQRDARAVFMELCRVYLTKKMSLSDLGRSLGGVSVSAITHNGNRLAVRMSQDRQLRRRFQDIEKNLQAVNSQGLTPDSIVDFLKTP